MTRLSALSGCTGSGALGGNWSLAAWGRVSILAQGAETRFKLPIFIFRLLKLLAEDIFLCIFAQASLLLVKLVTKQFDFLVFITEVSLDRGTWL